MPHTIDTTTPLITHFASRSLTELGISANILKIHSHHTPTYAAKTGLSALLGKLPKMTDKVAMDIDIGVGLFDTEGQSIQNVWYGNTRTHGDAVRHLGDSYHGLSHQHDTNHETISIRLDELNHKVGRVVIFVHSYHHQPLRMVKGGAITLSDHDETAIHELHYPSLDADVTSLAVWQLTRMPSDWRVDALMTPTKGKTILEVISNWQV